MNFHNWRSIEVTKVYEWKWLILFQLLFFIMFFSYIYLYTLVSRYDQLDPDGNHRQAGIILGAALWENHPSPALEERLHLAIQLVKQKKIDYLILSGGRGKAEISEAEAMAKYLIERGVAKKQLILEEESTNTKENLDNSAKLIQKHASQEVYIITHDYHMHRAITYAKQAKINAAPAPVHSTVLWPPYHKTRECLAIIKQQLTLLI